jgi:hypothetical protein
MLGEYGTPNLGAPLGLPLHPAQLRQHPPERLRVRRELFDLGVVARCLPHIGCDLCTCRRGRIFDVGGRHRVGGARLAQARLHLGTDGGLKLVGYLGPAGEQPFDLAERGI